MTEIKKDLYFAPKNGPVSRLECAEAFNLLSPKEKKYVHFMSEASWAGAPIILVQTSLESLNLFRLFQNVFSARPLEELKKVSLHNGVDEEAFSDFLQFATAFYGNMGNYLSFGDTKLIPRLSEEQFEKIVCSSGSESAVKLYPNLKEAIFQLNPSNLHLDLPEKNGSTTYYSTEIKKFQIELVQRFLQKHSISAYNTRLFILNGDQLELRIASVETPLVSVDSDSNPLPPSPGVYEFENTKIAITYQDHSLWLAGVVEGLRKALPYTANEHQKLMLESYINHFVVGDINQHKEAQRHWIKDIGPVVETNLGFIESYRDPFGERGEFESFVSIVDKEMSAKFQRLVDSAPKLLPLLPWPSAFEKDEFRRPDFTSLCVVTFVTSGIPAGINIPNYDDIRQNEGFKNVSLQNVLSAQPSNQAITFINKENGDSELYRTLQSPAFAIQVGLHELLGHGSGKLLAENKEGKLNFDQQSVRNPFTGEEIKSWYKHGETYDGKFGAFGSAMEECRAEAVGIYLSTDPDVLAIFGHSFSDAEQERIRQARAKAEQSSQPAKNITYGVCHDLTYVNWLGMARAGIRALEFYSPETNKWRQAHMQARFALLTVMLKAGQGFLEIVKDAQNGIELRMDRQLLETVGKHAVGDFLGRLNVCKATADYDEAVRVFVETSTPSTEILALRDEVLAKRQPRQVFVQPRTIYNSETDEVTIVDYEPSPAGLIQSFVDRFGTSV